MAICPACNYENPIESKFCSECGNPLANATGQLDSGVVLQGRYKIARILGRGGMGAVYLAYDQRLSDRPVALKEMSTSAVGPGKLEGAIDAFKKEASILSKLKHPSLPSISDFFCENDRWYLVMEYIEGDNLRAVVGKRGRIPFGEVNKWAEELASILGYLHSQDPPIIFRDLKPSNIMLTAEGKIKLVDFGIARHFKSDATEDTSFYGSTGFAPPEQYGHHQTNVRSDVYSLGATLHYLLTGIDPSKSPFKFETPSKSVQVSKGLEEAIMKSVSFNPQDRPASTQQFLSIMNQGAGLDNTATLSANTDFLQNLPRKGEATTQIIKPVAQPVRNISQPSVEPPKTPVGKKIKRFLMKAAIVLVVIAGVAGYGIVKFFPEILPPKLAEAVSGITEKSDSLIVDSGGSEKEPNDNIQTANDIKVNEIFKGNLQTERDQDYYKVKIGSKGKLTINIQHNPTDSGTWNVALLNSENQKLTEFGAGSEDLNKSSVAVRVSEGTYYVWINRGYQFNSTDYKFVCQFTEEDDFYEKEPNNNIQTAEKIQLNQTYTGNLQSDGDNDYYQIEVPSPGKVSLNLQHEQVGSGVWVINVLDAENRKLTEFSADSNDLNKSSLNLRLPGGSYYVWMQRGYSFSDVDYKLTVKYTAEGEGFEKEPNDKMQSGQTIKLNQIYTGNLQSPEDMDYYRFESNTDSKVVINLQHEQVGQGVWHVCLMDSSNNKLTILNSDANDLNVDSTAVRVPPGSYYLWVYMGYNYSDTDYKFSVNISQ